MKLRKKITAVFMGLALLAVVAGFCDSLIESAEAAMMTGNGHMQYSSSVAALHDNYNMPISSNTLKPCCVDKHTGAPSIETQNVNAGVKLAPLGVAVSVPDLSLFFANKLQRYSDTSPPKPDILASVLKRE